MAKSAKRVARKKKEGSKPAGAVADDKRAPQTRKGIHPEISVATAGRSGTVLDRLWEVVNSRRQADPSVSHSARLLSRGTAKVAQKFGEEAVECVIEAVAGNREALIPESADALYHLMVMWVSAGIRPDEVWAELERREGVSGIAEKASRVK
jgi:phosphoribosyl-ATP pyrophosphohydrolase